MCVSIAVMLQTGDMGAFFTPEGLEAACHFRIAGTGLLRLNGLGLMVQLPGNMEAGKPLDVMCLY